jgi:hypothetical protein
MTAVQHAPLTDWVKKPGFITKVGEAVRDGRKLVRVDFEFTEKLDSKDYKVPGWMLLDPDHFSCIIEYQLDYPEHEQDVFNVLHVANEVTTGAQGLPILKRVTFKDSSSKPRGTEVGFREVVYEYDFHESANVPDDEFTLSAFGLPEPQGVVWEKPSRWYLWFFGFAVLFLAGGAALFRRVQRRRERNAAVTVRSSAHGRNDARLARGLPT